MIKKSSTIIALGIILCSNVLPAIAETSSVIPKETSIINPSESSDGSSSQSSTTQTTSDSTTSDSTIDNENQELQKSQEDTQKDITTTAVQNTSAINNVNGEVMASDDIASGTWGSVPWVINNEGTLTLGTGTGIGTRPDGINCKSPWENYKNDIKKIIFEGKVTSAQEVSGLFQNLSNVTEIDNLEKLDTSNATGMQNMFLGMHSLTSLNLSSLDASNVTIQPSMLYNTPLKSLTLGPKFHFVSTEAELNAPSSSKDFDPALYTGKWQNIGSGTVYKPEGENIWTSTELMENYDGSKDADTYVWQPTTEAADVTVKYLDTDGNEIHNAQTISGNVGEAYDASTDTYKLAIDGYTLDTTKLPDNATGTLSDTAQTVTYVYTKNPVKAADVTVKYLDADGNEIHKAQTISGNVGEAYDASTDTYKLAIDGYTLDTTKLPDNATGTLSDTAQTVTYVYTKNPVKAADVTVKYLDAEGNEIHKAQTISGNVGEAYDASTDTYKLAIDGYTLDTTKLPDNATGTLSDTAQTVTYVYTKNPVKAADVTVKYLDADGNEIHKAQTISGNVGEAYDASTDTYKLAIDGYTLDTTKLPDNATGTLSDTAQTVTYVYTKNPVKAADVTVKYLDAEGNEIHKAQTISGNVGEAYDASTDTYKLDIDGYTLDTTKLPDNATGTLSETAQTITYVYTKNPVKAADVTVKYLDADGNEIHKAQTISGNVGEAYDASTDTYKLDIDGYTLDTTKLPDNATGILSDTAQTVTYVYKKTVTPALPVKPTPPTIPEQPIKPTPSSNSIPDVTAVTSSLPQTGDNQVISILMIFFGALLLSFSTILAFFKIKKS
ncbi:MucBP domain-containing protein [Lactococcus lactis]